MTAGQPITGALKRAIAESGMAHIAIERATGVKRQSIMRFMRGERSLRLDMADRLAAHFGLELQPAKERRMIGLQGYLFNLNRLGSTHHWRLEFIRHLEYDPGEAPTTPSVQFEPINERRFRVTLHGDYDE